jgi:hypothetical protein
MDIEDILNDSLDMLGEPQVDTAEEGRVRYGPLDLRVAPKVLPCALRRACRPFIHT